MVRKKNRPNVEWHVERSLQEFSFEQSLGRASPWADEMFLSFVDRVEIWIRPKMLWDERDHYDCRQLAVNIVTEANEHRRKNNLVWSTIDMISMYSTIANRKIANAINNATCRKNSTVLKSIDNDSGFDAIDCNCENLADYKAEFKDSHDYIWNSLDDDQKRVAELSQDENQTDQMIAKAIKKSLRSVCRIREDALEIARHHLGIRKRTGNREQGTGNREQGTGNREQGTGNRDDGQKIS